MNRLKNPIYTLLLITICLASSCGHREDITVAQLLRAEAVMDEHPDSALAIIMAVDSSALATPADSALYNLLLTQAQVKNDVPTNYIERISKAESYYRRQQDKPRLMLALLYLGEYQLGKGEYDTAVSTLLEAEQIATDTKNWFYLGLIETDISSAYLNVFSFEKSAKYNEKAVEAFHRSGNTEYWNYYRCSLANSLCNLGETTRAAEILDSVMVKAQEMKDTVTITTVWQIKVSVHINRKEWKEAIAAYEKVRQLDSSFIDAQANQRLAYLYCKTGQIDKADSIIALLSANHNNVYASADSYYESKGDYKQAYKSLLRQKSFTDSVLRVAALEKVSRTQSQFEELEMEKKNLTIRNQKLMLTLIIVCGIFVIAGLAAYIIARRRKLNQRLNSLVMKYNLVLRELEASAREHEGLEEIGREHDSSEASSPAADRFATLNAVCDEYYRLRTKQSAQQFIKKIESLIFSTIKNPKFNSTIFRDIDAAHDNLISQLQEAKTPLTDNDFSLLALLCSGLSYTAIAIVLDTSLPTMYVRKSRLKAKIAALDFPRKDEILTLI